MPISVRLVISLLVSTFFFSGFAIVSFTGLFPWMEAQFYAPRIVTDFQSGLDQRRGALVAWQKDVQQKLKALISTKVFEGAFDPTQNRQSLQTRYQSVKLFLQGFRSGASLRLTDSEVDRIHFSSVDDDLLTKGQFSLTYKRITDLSFGQKLKNLKVGLKQGGLAFGFDPETSEYFFGQAWKDGSSDLSGVLILTLGIGDARDYLFEKDLLSSTEAFRAFDAKSAVFFASGKPDETLMTQIKSLEEKNVWPTVQKLADSPELGPQVLITSPEKADGPFSRAAIVVPQSRLNLPEALKYLILIAFFTAIFLITFLILNWKGDPLSTISRKIKRFQIQVVKNYLDMKEQEKFNELRDALSRHSDRIKKDLQESLGRIRKKDHAWVDDYIDKSWTEILDMLGAREKEDKDRGSQTEVDWVRLERLLQETLTRANLGGPAVSGGGAIPVPIASRPATGDSEEIEELEELEELEEVGETVEHEEVQDAEEVEEIEELEEMEEGEPPEELQELEELAEGGEEVLEELEADGSGTADLEELLGQDGSTDLFELGGRRPDTLALLSGTAFGPEGVLESVMDEVAELLPLEEDENDSVRDFSDLPPDIVSFSLDDLDVSWTDTKKEVFEEHEEVITLKDDVFQEIPTVSDELGKLVKDVIEHSSSEVLEDDLVPQRTIWDWRWTGGGFDWDRLQNSGKNKETRPFQALTTAASEFGAFSAALLEQTENVWAATASVGFSDQGKDNLRFGSSSGLGLHCLGNRALHVINGEPGKNRLLWQSFHARDVKYLRAVVLVPVLASGKPAWLLLGYKAYPKKLIEQLTPRILN